MMYGHQGAAADTPLADCAFWAVRDLAAKFRQPCPESAEIVEQIAFAARALKAYRSEVNGKIPADFLPRALGTDTKDRPLNSSIEELLVGVTAVTTADEEDSDSSDETAVFRKLGDWLASACLRRGVEIALSDRPKRHALKI